MRTPRVPHVGTSIFISTTMCVPSSISNPKSNAEFDIGLSVRVGHDPGISGQLPARHLERTDGTVGRQRLHERFLGGVFYLIRGRVVFLAEDAERDLVDLVGNDLIGEHLLRLPQLGLQALDLIDFTGGLHVDNPPLEIFEVHPLHPVANRGWRHSVRLPGLSNRLPLSVTELFHDLELKAHTIPFWSFMSLAFLSEFEKQVTTYHNAGQISPLANCCNSGERVLTIPVDVLICCISFLRF